MPYACIQYLHAQLCGRKIAHHIGLIDHGFDVVDDRSADGPADHGGFADVFAYVIPAFRAYARDYIYVFPAGGIGNY